MTPSLTPPAVGMAGAIAWASVHHGFTRSPRHLAGVATLLSAAGIATVRPSTSGLMPRRSIHDPGYLTRRAIERAVHAEVQGLGELPWIGIGHSAGSAVALLEAAVRIENGFPVAGVILLDGTDTIGGVARLPDAPILLISNPPSKCNAQGALTARIRESREEFVGLTIVGGGHGDAERIGSGAPGHIPAVYRFTCGDHSAAEDVAIAESLLRGWTVDLALGREITLRPGHDVVSGWVLAGRVEQI